MPSRSNAPPSGSATSSNRRPLPACSPVKRSACRPSGSVVAERQLGHEVDLRVEQVGAGLAAVEVRHGAHLHPRRHVLHSPARAGQPAEGAQGAPDPGASPRLLRRRASGSLMPPERVLRFLLTRWPPFEASSSAPSHHLGVDVFVGTVLPSAIAGAGAVRTWLPPPSSSMREQREAARVRVTSRTRGLASDLADRQRGTTRSDGSRRVGQRRPAGRDSRTTTLCDLQQSRALAPSA